MHDWEKVKDEFDTWFADEERMKEFVIKIFTDNLSKSPTFEVLKEQVIKIVIENIETKGGFSHSLQKRKAK